MRNLFTRDDTLLGVCEGLGEEFGFRANYLRVALGAALLWNAEVIVAAYLAMGVVLAATRWAWPRRAKVADAVTPVANDVQALPLAQAA